MEEKGNFFPSPERSLKIKPSFRSPEENIRKKGDALKARKSEPNFLMLTVESGDFLSPPQNRLGTKANVSRVKATGVLSG